MGVALVGGFRILGKTLDGDDRDMVVGERWRMKVMGGERDAGMQKECQFVFGHWCFLSGRLGVLVRAGLRKSIHVQCKSNCGSCPSVSVLPLISSSPCLATTSVLHLRFPASIQPSSFSFSIPSLLP